MGREETSDERPSRLRGRLLPLLAVVAVVVAGSRLSKAVPREVSLRYDLGPDHALLTEARIGYRRDGEEVQAVRFTYDEGAPEIVSHHVSLSPGRYEVVADLLGQGPSRSFERTLDVPADGTVRLRLYEERAGR